MKVSTSCKSDGEGAISMRVHVRAKTVNLAKFYARDYSKNDFRIVNPTGISFWITVPHFEAHKTASTIRTNIRQKCRAHSSSVRLWNSSVKYHRKQKEDAVHNAKLLIAIKAVTPDDSQKISQNPSL